MPLRRWITRDRSNTELKEALKLVEDPKARVTRIGDAALRFSQEYNEAHVSWVSKAAVPDFVRGLAPLAEQLESVAAVGLDETGRDVIDSWSISTEELLQQSAIVRSVRVDLADNSAIFWQMLGSYSDISVVADSMERAKELLEYFVPQDQLDHISQIAS